MQKKIIFISVVLLVVVASVIVFFNMPKQEIEPGVVVEEPKVINEPEILKCLAKARRNISICDTEMHPAQAKHMESCKEDYYFFVSIADEEVNLCGMITDENIKKTCNAVVLKKIELVPSSICENRPGVCEYLESNNFKIDENFCDLAMKTDIGKQRCKAIIKKDDDLCYE